MNQPLANKVAIVTGSSDGIGRAIAQRLAADGASVVVNYLKQRDAAEKVVAEIKAEGGSAIAVQADASQPAHLEQLYKATLEAFGKPDIVVNNAGVGVMQTIADTTEEAFDRYFALNAKSALFSMKYAAQHMKDNGRLINISSSTTEFPVPGTAIYAGSKAAMRLFTKVGALELGARGITVNTVMPGVTETALSALLPQEFKDMVIRDTVLKRLGQPEDIADVVSLLVRDDAGWITGQEIVANGGSTH